MEYDVISVWECEKPEVSNKKLKKELIPYPCFIVYDFEALLNKLNTKKTGDLSFNNKHVSGSAGINDNLTNKPIFLVNPNPDELIKDFINDFQLCGKTIAEKVSSMYPMIDEESIPEGVRKQWEERCNQVPVLGFNSRKYDINMIKEYFVKHLTEQEAEISVAKKESSYMFLTTCKFKFLDLLSYLAPGLSFDGWCEANNCAVQKLVLPYEWLDSYEKLSHIGPVQHEDFYSSLQKKISITSQEYGDFETEFYKRSCVTMMDCLKEYNLADLGFLSRTFTIHGTAGEGGGYLFNSSLPLPPASRALRH